MKAIYTNKLHDRLDYIRLRTNLVLLSKSITALENYLSGYFNFFDWNNPGLIYNPHDIDFQAFKWYLHDEPIIVLASGPQFSKYLLEKCAGDEERAFDLFYELLDQFRERYKDPNSDGNVSNWWNGNTP